jgi:hypothetical protein
VAPMVPMDEAAALAAALPQVSEGERYGRRSWSVGKKTFAWERPFSKADIKRFGDAPVPAGPILALTTADLGEKEAILAAGDEAFFTIPHFDNYPAVLVQLDLVTPEALGDALQDAWAAVAPAELVAEQLDQS